MKNSPSCAHVLHKTLTLVISRCCFADDGKEMFQNISEHVQSDCFCLVNLLFCGVLVAVASLLLKFRVPSYLFQVLNGVGDK